MAILDLDIHPDDLWTSNGKTLRVQHWQKRIALGLGEFQGFHGNNYFVLGKPLLTSITANFINLSYHTCAIQSFRIISKISLELNWAVIGSKNRFLIDSI